MKARRFSASVYKAGINFAVDVPETVSLGFDICGHIPVVGTVNGLPIRTTLVPVGGGRHRMFLNGEIRKKAGVGDGDTVEIAVELDREPRVQPVPLEFAEALAKNEKAKEAWEKLPPSHKNEILAYLNSLKSPEALKRNVVRAIDNHLLKPKR
jgi:hypothetical protein